MSLDGIRIRKVTQIQSICDIFKEIHKLFKLYLTIPVTTVSSEPSFSALKHVKSYLRGLMTLNHCMLLHVHKDKTQKLNLCQLVEDFVKVNNNN